MSYTNYAEHAILDYMFGATAFPISGVLYLALSTTQPTEAGGNFTEPPQSSGYNRKAITNNKSNWTVASQVGTSGQVNNLSGLSFGTASGNWGTVAYYGLYDALSSGNLIIQSALTVAKTPTSGDIVNFPSGALVIRLD